LEQKVVELSEQIVSKIAEIKQLKEQYMTARYKSKEALQEQEIKVQLSEIKRSLKQDWQLWVELSRNILQLKSARN
jgi:hypothetical protein